MLLLLLFCFSLVGCDQSQRARRAREAEKVALLEAELARIQENRARALAEKTRAIARRQEAILQAQKSLLKPKKPAELTEGGSNKTDSGATQLGTEFVNVVGMQLVLIPHGEFKMGSDDGYDNQKPVHQVQIAKSFYMAMTEVTQEQWEKVMQSTPWKETGRDKEKAKSNGEHAASYISWEDAVLYCELLSKIEGKTYRLPTEAEWEYACRAGSETAYSFGDDIGELKDFAWFKDNAPNVGEDYVHAVGRKKPNQHGLFDMHGNVWEWCYDEYVADYSTQLTPNNATGSLPASDTSRVMRGGSWHDPALVCRSAYRYHYFTSYRFNSFGFRVVCESE
jgi:formylglycine-generating enzyme